MLHFCWGIQHLFDFAVMEGNVFFFFFLKTHWILGMGDLEFSLYLTSKMCCVDLEPLAVWCLISPPSLPSPSLPFVSFPLLTKVHPPYIILFFPY